MRSPTQTAKPRAPLEVYIRDMPQDADSETPESDGEPRLQAIL